MPIFVSTCDGTFQLQPFFFFLVVRWCCSSQHFTLNLCVFFTFCCSSCSHSCGAAVSNTLFFMLCVLVFLTHCFHVMCAGIPHTLFIFPYVMWWCCFRHIFILCVLVFLTQFSFTLSVMWWCCFRRILILCMLVFLAHCSSFYLSCGDAISATLFSFYVCWYSSHIFHYTIHHVLMPFLPQFSFVCWYSSHIVHHSIRHVVMLFPPHIHSMCACIPHTFSITLSIMYWCLFCHILVLCAGIPHTLFLIPPVMWWCCLHHVIFILRVGASIPRTFFPSPSFRWSCCYHHIILILWVLFVLFFLTHFSYYFSPSSAAYPST